MVRACGGVRGRGGVELERRGGGADRCAVEESKKGTGRGGGGWGEGELRSRGESVLGE